MVLTTHRSGRLATVLIAIAAAGSASALSPATSLVGLAQDSGGDASNAPVDLPAALKTAPKRDEIALASDGQPATAGRVPEGTPGDAAELWRQVVSSLTIDGAAEMVGPRAFELEFEVRQRTEAGAQNFLARFSYLDHGPGLVRGVVLNSKGKEKSTQMRGLTKTGKLQYSYRKLGGKGATDGWIRLTGRENKESRDEVDSWASISFNIARLTRPGSLRIIALRERRVDASAEPRPGVLQLEGDVGLMLPSTDVEGVRGGGKQPVAELCAGLRWLEMTTPDFRLFRDQRGKGSEEAPSVFRLLFGVDPETWRPQIVVVAPGKDGRFQVPGTVLIQSTEWFKHGPDGDKSWLPGRFFAYETELANGDGPTRLRFSDVPAADLYMQDGGSMNAALGLADFLPD